MKQNRKTQITNDWKKAFPQLTEYSPNKLYKILGSTIVGIELIKLPGVEAYRPYFVIYPLWGNKGGNDLKSCLSSPLVLKEFYDTKGLQFSISYHKHPLKYKDAVSQILNQLPFTLEGDVSIKEMFSAFDKYSNDSHLSAAPNSYLQGYLLQSKLELALCSGTDKQVKDIFDQIKFKNWDEEHFLLWDVNIEQWISDLNDKITNKYRLISQLKTNIQEQRMGKLQVSNLLLG